MHGPQNVTPRCPATDCTLVPAMCMRWHSRSLALRARMCCAIAILALCCHAWDSVHAQNLLTLTEQTLAYDAQWQAQTLEVQAADQRRLQARAGLLPYIGLQASHQHSDTRLRTQNLLGSSTQPLQARQDSVTLQLLQPLYAPARQTAYRQSEQAVELTYFQQETARQALLLQVAQAYFEALMSRDTLTVQQALVAAIAQQARQAQRNFDAGLSTITDVREAQARLDLALAQQTALDAQHQSALLTLEKLSGTANPTLWTLPTEAPLPTLDATQPAQWLQELTQVHPALQQASIARRLAALETEKAQAGHLPTVELQASYGQQRNPDGTLLIPTHHRTAVGTIGVQAHIPLFAGFATQSRVQEARTLEEKAEAQWLETLRTLEQSVRQAWLQLTAAQQQSTALEQAVHSSHTALQATQTGYRVGVRLNVDVLNAQAQWHAAQKDWLRARYQVLQGHLQLLQAAGRLQLQDVEAISALLQPPA